MTIDGKTKWALALVLIAGCRDDGNASGGTTGEASSSSGADTVGTATDTTGPDSPTTGDDADTTAGSGDTTGAPPGDGGDPPGPPVPCPETWSCQEDPDGDDRPFQCDNAPDDYNPDQGDIDYDSLGDVIDLCPTVQTLDNGLDADLDGVGSGCDVCPRPVSAYGVSQLPPGLRVRNTPHQGDFDRDGIGDACDNCPLVPNCLGYGDGPGLVAWVPGLPVDHEDPDCAPDADGDGIGDACDGTPGTGFAPGDDWDGDGIANGDDPCPRVRAPDGGHPDPDGDGIGTECDVCPFVADPEQGDEDGDFIGDACEEDAGCVERVNPRRLGFFDVAVGGYCCTTVYDGGPLQDPDGMRLSVDDLPVTTPGLVELPPGCDAALAEAGLATATPLGPDDVGGLAALWTHMCLLPAADQDLDAVPDACDLCAFAFDPDNTPYVDKDGMVWPSNGAFCTGEYQCSAE
jgi:hypothetical protein